MPTRIVREGILTSEQINSLSERAEIFYRRLMSVADDYGRYFAHAGILRAHCFPAVLDRYSEADVRQMLSECVAKDTIMVYGDGKYLVIHKFKQQTRSPSKFPEPTQTELLSKCKADAKPMLSLVGVGVGVGVGVEGVSGVGAGNEIPTLAMCQEYASNPACGFPPELVEEWFNKSSDRGWGQDWRARMRGAVATYRGIQNERNQKNGRQSKYSGATSNQPSPSDGQYDGFEGEVISTVPKV